MAKPASSKKGRRPLSTCPASQIISRHERVFIVDAVRGIAVMLMMGFHFCFDLNYFKLASFDFYFGPFWLAARAMIVTLFLLLVGVSLQLASTGRLNIRAYSRRLALLAACAGIVSASSYGIFPNSGIFFGVLHFILVASILGLIFTRFNYLNLMLGTGWILAGLAYQNAWFDQAWLNWIGFMTHKPVTQDYVPLFPWFGVVLLGLFMGRWLASHETAAAWKGVGKLPLTLLWLGRHSLVVYMLHQPLLLGALYLVSIAAT
jgi:uncharacterized membrane protein